VESKKSFLDNHEHCGGQFMPPKHLAKKIKSKTQFGKFYALAKKIQRPTY
jgi:hypothetical protein